MNINNITSEIRYQFERIISMDKIAQKRAIESIYDEGCNLTSPYMALCGRDQIVQSYATLASNNMELTVQIGTVSYDPDTQIVMTEIQQIIRPKALGGVMSIRMHFFIKLQLEPIADGLYAIVDHTEIHVGQDLISQMPIIGGLYDGRIRNALGQVSLAGTSLLEYSGFLEFAPRAVDEVKNGASSIKNKVGSLTSQIFGIGSSVLKKVGVSDVLDSTLDYAKRGASTLYEKGTNEKIDCYSSSCRPGSVCYSPTCPRNASYSFLSVEAMQGIIQGAYTKTSETFLRAEE